MDQLLSLLQQYKYLVLFPLCIIEGPIVAVLVGLLCMNGILNPLLSFPIIVAGDVAGDTILYLLGRWGNERFLTKIGKWIGLNAEKINRVRGIFLSNPIKTITLSKMVLGIGVAGIYLAGNARVRYSTFFKICMVTSAAQYIAYLGIGFLFGSAYHQINRYLNGVASVTVIVAALILVFYIIRSIKKKL